MTALLSLAVTILVVLLAAYVPGYAAVRVLDGSRLLALGLAPAVGAALAGVSALFAPFLGIDWSLIPFLLGALVMICAALGLRRAGIRLPSTVLDGRLMPRRAVPGAAAWIGGALAIAVAPIAIQARRPDAVLERWDTLYHLSALQRVRETGSASSLDLGSVSNSAATPTAYPAGFHALAALVPGVEVPILLNGAVLALATVPWILGTAVLARTLYPRVAWAPFAAALVAALIPASPLNLWVHLSPVPNLSGFAALPGAVAAAAALWGALLPVPGRRTAHRRLGRATVAAVLAVGMAGLGLGLLHPNAAVTALILLAVLTATTTVPHLRSRPWLLAVPVVALLPVALLAYTPLGAKVTGFSGGLQVPWWSALGEIMLGLLTVWPMALGVVLAVLWWPGLVSVFRSPQRWVGIAWIVIAVIYMDAALDSPLNLSVLYYRGQDRVAMPLAMLSTLLVIPGLQLWARLIVRRTEPSQTPPTGASAPASPRSVLTARLALVLVAAAIFAAVGSVPSRNDNAAKNFASEYPGRGRFLQADERELFAQHAPTMDPDAVLLASPFSGGAHMYALEGIPVHFPVAGMSARDLDAQLLTAAPLAATDPAACRALTDAGVGYIYQERRPYARSASYLALNTVPPEIGEVVFETSHSRLLKVDCDDHG